MTTVESQPQNPRQMQGQLVGCTEGLVVQDAAVRLWIVTRLMTCNQHHGVHHFAVTDEGTTIWMSATGIECIGIDEERIAQIGATVDRIELARTAADRTARISAEAEAERGRQNE